MRFAIDITIFGEYGDPLLLVELARQAEASGWDGFFLWDHLVPPTPVPTTDPWVVMSAIAATTERILFGPMVTPLARRRASKVARETVALDRLSGGRFVMGVGLGAHDEPEFEAFGDAGDRRQRAAVLDESLEILDGLWTGDPYSFVGEHLVASGHFLPTAIKQPRIPVWVAGLWPNKRPMLRAAAWDGAFPIDAAGDFEAMLSLEDMAAAIAFIHEHRSGDGRFDIVHAGLLSGDVRRDADNAAAYADVGVTWWLEHVYPGRLSVGQLRKLIAAGPPREP
jgi:alkanesulfonate monooxygenase SsuD/methylene tetrahydromethanopterin reductase-like flavin-dependent oxidoreductase (luciferase family)